MEEPAQSEVIREIPDLSKEGYRLLKMNRIAEAEDAFKKILAIEKSNNYALVGLGDCARKRRAPEEAVKYYEECLSYHNANNYALFGLADCYKSMRQYEMVIEVWERYLERDGRNVTVLTRVADACRKTRDFRKSEELYQRALDIEHDNPYALIGLGHLHYDFKEYEDALYYWTRAFESAGGAVDIRVLTSIGNCHRKLKNFDEGVPYFERALQLDPSNFYALYGLADCYRGMNQQYRSIEYWNRILKIDPTNKVIMTRAGDAYRNMGDFERAREYYNRALDIEFDIYAAMGLALLCKEEGKYDEAVSRFENLIRNDAANYRLYIDLAECFLNMRRKQDAISTLERFQRLGIQNQTVSEMLDGLRASAM